MDVHSENNLHGTLGDFKFKYVAEEELLRIVRKVQRQRRKERDALLWKSYVEESQRSVCAKPSCSSKNNPCESIPVKNNAGQDTVCDLCNNQIDSENCKSVRTSEKPVIPMENEISVEPKISLPPKHSTHSDNFVLPRESRSLQRIAALRYRIGLALDGIFGMIQCQPLEPDGPDDLERRRTRTNEFLSRFSRNYLFQLRIQVAELRRHLVFSSLETPGRHTEHQALMQKFVSAHQTAVQSLQAYLTQLPASIHLRSIFGKLHDLLRYLCDLSSLKAQLESHAVLLDGIHDVQDKDELSEKCRELMTVLEEKQAELEDASVSARATPPHSTRGSVSLLHQQPKVNNRIQGNLQGSWKRSAMHLARQRFGPPSSIRSSASPRLSSRGHPSSDNKRLQNHSVEQSDDMRELLMHIHDVLCHKVTEKNFKKSKRKRSKRFSQTEKVQTEVQNLSSNIQLTITRHQDSDAEECQDKATDTVDLNPNQTSGYEKKNKKVGWAEPGALLSENSECAIAASSKDLKQIIRRELPSKGTSRRPSMSVQKAQCYRDRFHVYKNHLQTPTFQRWCDNILDSVFQEVTKELEPSFLLEKMYHLELKD